LLQVGFTKPPQSPAALVVSYTTVSPLPGHRRQAPCPGGLFSVALSRGSPRVGVTDHLALRSPDLPHRDRSPSAAARPGSVHPRERGPTAIHLGLPLLTASCGLPASIGRAALNRSRSLPAARTPRRIPSDLAPGGVYRAAAVTCGAGGLLHHRFTLTSGQGLSPAPRRSAFCGTVPRVTPGRRYRPPCPAEPGPSSPEP